MMGILPLAPNVLRLLYVFSCTLHVSLGQDGFVSAKANSDVTLNEKDAKTFLIRMKRGWIHEVTRGEEIKERIQKEMERKREIVELHKHVMCSRKCWDQWQAWGACTGKCNSGISKRIRKQKIPASCRRYPCPGSSMVSKKCHMNCGIGGDVVKGACKCHTGFYGDCCSGKIMCNKPPKPQNGFFEGIRVWPVFYNSVLTYKCNPGYILIGPEQRRCQLNRKWSGKNPFCRRIVCSTVRPPDYGSLVNAKKVYYFGDTVAYKCNVGYVINGMASRLCTVKHGAQHGSWATPAPTCAAVDCSDPGTPRHGSRSAKKFTYNEEVTFTCHRGFELSGSSKRKCLPTGKWSGRQPVCKEIRCEVLEKPLHGLLNTQNNSVDSVISFQCNPGYRLIGQNTLQCLQNGSWDGPVPKCDAITCRNPGSPKHGAKRDSGFRLGQKVHFSCFAGYVLSGANQIICQRDGSWTAPTPTCTVCPKNHYKFGPADGGKCVRCPRHSHTVTPATPSKKQCICDHGYRGPSGGPCLEIQCPVHRKPQNGNVVSCGRKVDDLCNFKCNDGYILNGGSSVRVCTDAGTWDGKPPSCQACPVNTYKAGAGSCISCPPNAHTTGVARMKIGCLCNENYKGPPGGPCADRNECEIKGGRGLCEDECVNYKGGYTCRCTTPGYKVDPLDKHSCTAAKQCRNLTETDAPDHGGLVCKSFKAQNSKYCTVKCNPGYDFSDRSNNFETCGPTTGFKWTYQKEDANATLSPCVEEFFPGYRIEADSAYFVRACKDLTQKDQIEVKKNFVKTLNEHKICQRGPKKLCDITHMSIICGRTTFKRRKRGVDEQVTSVDLGFNVEALQVKQKRTDCPQICSFLGIPKTYCPSLCIKTYNMYLKAAVQFAKITLLKLYKTKKRSMQFWAARRQFEPVTGGLRVSGVLVRCKPGMKEEKEKCVPCTKGTHFASKTNKCVPCPLGTYQPFMGQAMCVPCQNGSTTYKPGGLFCQVCNEGFFGENCTSKCECVHGHCHPRTGACTCSSGWEGAICNIDVPGCRSSGCFRNVTCTDVPAPGVGYTCGSCPSGFYGDGSTCMPRKRTAARSLDFV